MKIGNLSYKMGFLVTKWESWLQNKIFAYQKGFLAFKWESRFAIHRRVLLFQREYMGRMYVRMKDEEFKNLIQEFRKACKRSTSQI